MSNKFRQFERLVGSERRLVGEVHQVRGDGTTIVRTPENRFLRVQGDGIQVGSQAFVRVPVGGRPELEGPAPTLPSSLFPNL